MIHKTKNNGFTLVELIVVIAIIAILSGIAIPLYANYIEKSKDAEAIANAKNAWTQHLADNVESAEKMFIYVEDEERIAAIKNGGVLDQVFGSQREAIKALADDPETMEDESAWYQASSTSVDKLYVVTTGDEGEKTNWTDTTAVFVGDSITHGSGTTKLYHAYLEEMLGFSSVTNMGVAGSCISTKSDYGSGNSPLTTRYQSIPDADLIVLFMGTNDYGHETPLGSADDIGDISFYGALNVVIPGIIEAHPNSTFVVITPLHRYGFGTSKLTGEAFTYDYLPNGRGHNLEDYVNAIKTVCGKWSVPVIDLYTKSGLDPSNPPHYSTYMPDGLHPNEAGHEKIAQIIKEHLEDCPKNAGTNGGESNITPPQDETIILQYGNKFASGYATDPTRVSSATNLYLTAGQTVTITAPGKYEWALGRTKDEYSSAIIGNYYPKNGWTNQSSCTITESGYYGITLKKSDGSAFDFASGQDSMDLYDYITVN